MPKKKPTTKKKQPPVTFETLFSRMVDILRDGGVKPLPSIKRRLNSIADEEPVVVMMDDDYLAWDDAREFLLKLPFEARGMCDYEWSKQLKKCPVLLKMKVPPERTDLSAPDYKRILDEAEKEVEKERKKKKVEYTWVDVYKRVTDYLDSRDVVVPWYDAGDELTEDTELDITLDDDGFDHITWEGPKDFLVGVENVFQVARSEGDDWWRAKVSSLNALWDVKPKPTTTPNELMKMLDKAKVPRGGY